MASRSTLLELLLEEGSISSVQLESVIHEQQEHGGSIADIVLRQGLISEEDLFFFLSHFLGIPAIPEDRLLHLTLTPELRRRVPRSLALKYVLIPFDLEVKDGILSVAMVDPSDRQLVDSLRQSCRVAEIRAYLARQSIIRQAVDTAYTVEDEPLDGATLENLPFIGVAIDPANATNRPSNNFEVELLALEPKVQIDPQLAEEIALLSSQAELARSAKSKRRFSPNAPISSGLRGNTLFTNYDNPLDESVTPITPITPLQEIRARSLLHLPPATEELKTTQFVLADQLERTDEIDLKTIELDRLKTRETELMDLTPQMISEPIASQISNGESPSPEHEALLHELLSSVGILVSMLEERIDETGGSYREYGRISRLTARELGMDPVSVDRIALAAHLFGLDVALRRELGLPAPQDVNKVFSLQSSLPGGIGPSLRMLGAKALGLSDSEAPAPPGLKLIRLVVDYWNLCDESEGAISDFDTVAQLLRTGGGDPLFIDALMRALEAEEREPNSVTTEHQE